MTRRRFVKLSLYTALTACTIDAVAVEPRWIETTRYDVRLSRLPKELDGFTIAQLSDLHRSLIVPDSLIREAIETVNGLKPDLVVATGDFVSKRASNAEPCAEMLSKLKSRLGTCAVLGNHDHWTDAELVRSHLERKSITVLVNENTRIVDGLTLLGVDDFWAGSPDFTSTWNGVDPEDAHVFLSHNPLAVRMVKHHDCLMITGHTHGGQINLPFVPRRSLPGLKGWRYVRGWFRVGEVQMYVNRGIGVVGPPVRFMCRPEVTLYTLRTKD